MANNYFTRKFIEIAQVYNVSRDYITQELKAALYNQFIFVWQIKNCAGCHVTIAIVLLSTNFQISDSVAHINRKWEDCHDLGSTLCSAKVKCACTLAGIAC